MSSLHDLTIPQLLARHYPIHNITLTLIHTPNIFRLTIQEETAFRLDAIAKGFQAYPYCLVMEAADDTLKRIIGDQHIAGEWAIWEGVYEGGVFAREGEYN